MATNAQTLASLIDARSNCKASKNTEWFARHSDRIGAVMRSSPSGSGIDNGTRLDVDECTENRLVFTCSFHHMNESGSYDGWTEHRLTVTPSFTGVAIHISGRNRNDIKDYLHAVYSCWLGEECAP